MTEMGNSYAIRFNDLLRKAIFLFEIRGRNQAELTPSFLGLTAPLEGYSTQVAMGILTIYPN